MDAAAWRRALLTFLLLVAGTGLLGVVATEQRWIGPRSFVAYLFAIPLAGAMLAAQHYRHHGASVAAIVLGGVSGFAAQASLLGTPLLLYALREGTFEGIDRAAVTLMLLTIPLLMGAASGLGTAVLVQGVRRYRARHGRVHAPH